MKSAIYTLCDSFCLSTSLSSHCVQLATFENLVILYMYKTLLHNSTFTIIKPDVLLVLNTSN